MDLMQSAFAAGIVVNAIFTIFLLLRIKLQEERTAVLVQGAFLQDELNRELAKFTVASNQKMDALHNTLESLVSTEKSS